MKLKVIAHTSDPAALAALIKTPEPVVSPEAAKPLDQATLITLTKTPDTEPGVLSEPFDADIAKATLEHNLCETAHKAFALLPKFKRLFEACLYLISSPYTQLLHVLDAPASPALKALCAGSHNLSFDAATSQSAEEAQKQLTEIKNAMYCLKTALRMVHIVTSTLNKSSRSSTDSSPYLDPDSYEKLRDGVLELLTRVYQFSFSGDAAALKKISETIEGDIKRLTADCSQTTIRKLLMTTYLPLVQKLDEECFKKLPTITSTSHRLSSDLPLLNPSTDQHSTSDSFETLSDVEAEDLTDLALDDLDPDSLTASDLPDENLIDSILNETYQNGFSTNWFRDNTTDPALEADFQENDDNSFASCSYDDATDEDATDSDLEAGFLQEDDQILVETGSEQTLRKKRKCGDKYHDSDSVAYKKANYTQTTLMPVSSVVLSDHSYCSFFSPPSSSQTQQVATETVVDDESTSFSFECS